MPIQLSRQWAMPSADTFDVPPIGDFVKKYLRQSKVSIDPFARNKRWATYTNDLNPETAAEYHLDALEFLKMLKERGVVADLVIFDPPYSVSQVKQCYEGIGLSVTQRDVSALFYSDARNAISEVVSVGGIVLSFGWSSVGLGATRNFKTEEIFLVCHGGAHNDTICMAERKMAHQERMFA